MARRYGKGGSNPPYLPVVTVPDGTTVQAVAERVAAVFRGTRRGTSGSPSPHDHEDTPDGNAERPFMITGMAGR